MVLHLYTALCIISLCFLRAVHSESWDTELTNIDARRVPIDFLRYGLLQNGSMFIHLEAEEDTLSVMFLLVCSENEYFIVHEESGICEYLQYGEHPCKVTQLFHRSLRLYYYFPEFGEYYFSLARCDLNPDSSDERTRPRPINIMVHLEIENPNGNHLQSTLVPAPTMYVLVAVVWAITLLLWLFVAAPKWKNMSPLQYTMLTYPVMKIICSACSAQYLYTYQVYEDVSIFSWVLYRALLIVVLLDFHYVLLLLSKAWSISGILHKSDYHLMFSMLVGLCCSLMFKYFYDNSDLAFLLASLAYIGLRVMILACVFININHTIGRLESEMLNYNAELEHVNIRPTVVKLHKIFVLIKFALMMWVILNVAEFFCNILFFGGTEQNWIDMMNTEFIDFLLSLCVGILLLPNLSLQIDITTRRSRREAMANQNVEENALNTDEEQNETLEDIPPVRRGDRPVVTNEHGELELTTFSSTTSSTSTRPSFTTSSPLLTPESIPLPNGSARTNNYQKIEYQVEDEEEYGGSDDEVQLVDKRRVNVQ